MPSSTFNPRQRLSILTNASLGHDVSAAFQASSSSQQERAHVYGETAAPPPSPIDFSFPSSVQGEDARRRTSSQHTILSPHSLN
ncbi:uncharacterized protein M421DRAFT_2430 [Didymella exigua CBS 183.55]|uniref:Uncharacterized protein n=1 Tax=Didymella exigua CBS 183.55 TaxID=1150837 RepID=A0A6A5RVB0_9PLEO|nr:uncharacterized protein M421DRAFT_2430 [Didymella exigua CBS 183.55]KAF1931802.1 hypothetical protein M421DRAFT_2430 [Didymella exigua CBS 183.55]